jgi:hypothetical protein
MSGPVPAASTTSLQQHTASEAWLTPWASNTWGGGTDMYGFIAPPVFHSYKQLPASGKALRAGGFSQPETEQMLGGTY